MQPTRSYVLACTPRVGSHLLADALTATGIAGRPREWLPRYTAETAPRTPLDRMKLVTQPPPDVAYDPAADAEAIRKFVAAGTTENGVFGTVVHWLVQQDAVRRLRAYAGTDEPAPHRVLAAAFPELSYVWLRRRDKVAQAVSWYKAIQTGVYVGRHGPGGAGPEEEALHFDYGKIRYLLTALTSFENAQGLFFSSSGLTPLVLHYEELAADYVGTVRSVLEFLRLDPDSVEIARPKREKYADAQSREWIEQFTRLHNQSRSTRR
ncbi:MAG TPA: Stf0 family sulfotransferase [Longimicrobium sp.]|nr:Stf0 family sulfotransferase [Longimicrobium sp.]